MQKLLSLFLFFSMPLLASYIGNPSGPCVMNSGFFSRGYLIKGTSGYLYDYSTIKRYHAPKTKEGFDPNSTFKEFGIHSQMGTLSLILLERIEIFGALGGSKEQTKGKTHPSTPFEFESKYQFSWAAGAKTVLLQWGTTSLGCDFTYFAIPSTPQSFFQYFDRFQLPIDFGKQKVYLNEWEIACGLSTRFFGMLAPYIAGSYLYSHLHVDESKEIGKITYENQSKWGYLFGITLSLTGKFHINLERRLKNESGYSLATIAVF